MGNGKGLGLVCNDLEQADLPTPDVYLFTAPRSPGLAGLKKNTRRSAVCELLVVWLLSADDIAAAMTTGFVGVMELISAI